MISKKKLTDDLDSIDRIIEVNSKGVKIVISVKFRGKWRRDFEEVKKEIEFELSKFKK